MARFFLTDTLVNSALCAADKSQEIICDCARGVDGRIRNGSVAGLGLRVTALGAKSFVHSYRFNGKARREVIGSPSNMNVTSARMAVQQRNHEIDQGNDPKQNKKIDFHQKHGETLGEIIDAYYEQHLSRFSFSHRAEFGRLIAPWTREEPKNPHRGGKRSKKPTIGEMLRDVVASDITPRHIGPYLQNIQSDSVANSALRQLKALFNWSIRQQITDMRNPCSPFQLRKIIKKRRDFTPEQVREIAWHVFNPPMRKTVDLTGLEGRVKQAAALEAGRIAYEHEQLVELCHFMGVLFLTMARPIEVKRARYIDFDLDRLIWSKNLTKGIRLSRAIYEYESRAVPIHPKVAELINLQRARWPDSPYPFPNHADQTQYRDNFNRAFKRFKQLDGVPASFQLYDIRRMAISLMITGQSVRRDDVQHLVEHKDLETTLRYDLNFVEPMRPVTAKLGEMLGV